MILLQAAGSGTSSLIMFGLIFAVMYFFMIRPQIKKQREEQKFRDELKKGDKVITVGGIHGKIVELSEKTVVVENNGVRLKIERSSIAMNVSKD